MNTHQEDNHGMWAGPRRLLIIALAVLAVGIIATVSYYRAQANRPGYGYVRGGGDTINVAIAYSPMSLYRYEDTLGGFNYEVMKGVASMYDDHVKFYPVVTLSDALAKLRSGVYDVLMADIPMTAPQREHYLFTEPVYTDRQVLVSRDTTLNSPLELAGKEVWVVEGSPAILRLENLAREIGDSIPLHITQEYSAEQLVIMTALGEIPRAVVNEGVARRLQPEYPDAHISTHISFSQFQSWILNKNSKALADTLNSQLTRFKQTGIYRELLEKYRPYE